MNLLSPSSSRWFLALTLATSAAAQEDPQDLVKLRESYNSRLAETLRTTVGDYHQQLAALEKERSAAGDYAGAHSAKARAAMLTIQFSELSGGAAAGFTLDASRASTSGSVSLDRTTGILKKFASEGSRATWDARQSTADAYDVYITYSSPGAVDNPAYADDSSQPRKLVSGGTIAVREATSLARGEAETLTHTIEPTGSWDTFETIKIGTINLMGASTSIEVVAEEVEPEGLMHLRQIRFQRIPPPTDPSAPPPGQLIALQEEHHNILDKILEPLITTQIKSLEQLASEASATGNLDTVVAVRAEIERLKEDGPAIGRPAQNPQMQDAIVLDAVDSLRVRTTGSITASSKGFLTAIAPEAAFVEWDIRKLGLPPGFYEVGLRFRATDTCGGTFRIQSGESSFTGSIRRNERFTSSTPFRDRPAGILYLTEEAAELRLTVASLLPGGDSLFDLESVSLRLTDRESFEQAKIREQSQQGENQWVKLEGARFKTKAGSPAADNFHIVHGGEEFHLRLYGADSPPATYEDPSYISSQASQFGLTEEQVLKLGKEAYRFTRNALTSAPFIVFTKNEDASYSEDQKRIFAFVVTQDGLLSHQLVLAGLAKAEGTFSDAPEEINPGVTAEIHETWIRGEELKARKANRGMWRFKQ